MDTDNPYFNASLRRLEQLMNNLDDLSKYAVNDNVLGMFANLRELKKKTKGYLDKKQKVVLKNKWDKIKSHKINITEDNISYNETLPELLHDLDEWIQYTLHKNGILYKGSEVKQGLAQMRAKYKLQDNGDRNTQ